MDRFGSDRAAALRVPAPDRQLPPSHSESMGLGSISACLVVRNEEAVIERCLASLADLVDEIIVVHDGPCEDRTLDTAEKFGAHVFVGEDKGMAEYHEVAAFRRARGEWILNVDADEFLSNELRRELRSLVANRDVSGYRLLWRMWDGRRYISDNGPFKLVLFRRAHAHMLGLLHFSVEVDGRVDRRMLQLEHRPLYNNFSLRIIASKQRRWARLHARQLVGSRLEIPTFNMDAAEWPAWRRTMNWFSPILVLPYGFANAAVAMWRDRDHYAWRRNARIALQTGIYNAMVMLYVARYRYLGLAADDPGQ